MVKLSVMYPQQQGKQFNMEYYLSKHMPLVREKWRVLLQEAYVTRGLAGGAPGAPPVYHVMAHISFASMDDLNQALKAGGELFADIPNFTDLQPAVQIGEVVG